MERLLTMNTTLPCLAWMRMQVCYGEAVDHAPTPDQITLERITAKREELYSAVPPPLRGDYYHTVSPPPIEYSVPTEKEFEWAAYGPLD